MSKINEKRKIKSVNNFQSFKQLGSSHGKRPDRFKRVSLALQQEER
jgi:hypothetical protein